MERLVLVHGSVGGGGPTWSAQLPLAERFELLVLERELRAERAVLFNGVLADFIERATLPWRALRRNRAGSRTTPRRPKERPSHNL